MTNGEKKELWHLMCDKCLMHELVHVRDDKVPRYCGNCGSDRLIAITDETLTFILSMIESEK
jgi:hypothetical protein